MQAFRILMLFLLMTLFACSPQTGRRILSVFFDGVPMVKSRDTTAQQADSLKLANNTGSTIALASAADSLVYHPPYRAGKCNLCHKEDNPTISQSGQEELCFTCHTDFRKTFKNVHDPTADGSCTKCHAPHYSKHPFLLLNAGRGLCQRCHYQEYLNEVEIHQKNPDRICRECHNPHGGDDNFFLKQNP